MRATHRKTVSKQVRKPVFLVDSHFVELPVHYVVSGGAWVMYLETLRCGVKWQIGIKILSVLPLWKVTDLLYRLNLEDLGTSPVPFRKVLGAWFQTFIVG